MALKTRPSMRAPRRLRRITPPFASKRSSQRALGRHSPWHKRCSFWPSVAPWMPCCGLRHTWVPAGDRLGCTTGAVGVLSSCVRLGASGAEPTTGTRQPSRQQVAVTRQPRRSSCAGRGGADLTGSETCWRGLPPPPGTVRAIRHTRRRAVGRWAGHAATHEWHNEAPTCTVGSRAQ